MTSFRKWLPKWAAVSHGNYGHDRGDREEGGENSSSTELSSLGTECSREHLNTSSVWKPVWYTGWHAGVLACATSAVVVLFINVGLTIYAATNPGYEKQGGIVTLYNGGSCDQSKKIGTWLHLGINALSTLLLSGSNYTQQCLAAPTRREIDAAHARRQWMDIGVPSVRNLFRIKRERAFLWIVIGLTSVPLHLLYNSAVFTSIAVGDFVVAFVTSNYFELGAYSNFTAALGGYELWEDRVPKRSLFGPALRDYWENSQTYEKYEESKLSNCIDIYKTDFVSGHGNLFLTTKYPSNAPHKNTLLGMISIDAGGTRSSSWMCSYEMAIDVGHIYRRDYFVCDPGDVASNVAKRLPWRLKFTNGNEVEITGCTSKKIEEDCKVQFSLGIMIAVIFCNLVKACCMIIAVVRTREPTLVTLGDAADSFLRIPDQTTIGMCFADRRFVTREWRRGGRPGARRWKQKGVQKWWNSVSKKRWLICNFFCLTTIIVAGVLLRMGIQNDMAYGSRGPKSMWHKGFGKVNSVSLVRWKFRNITGATLLANLPQTILSFLYLTYNSLFTCMLLGHEWSLFAHHHRTLRVTSPRPGQRSTYWLQIPYTYGIPLMTLSGLLHWLTSQSIFLARIEVTGQEGGEPLTKNVVGYSCISIVFVIILGSIALVTAAGMGSKAFAAEITTVGSCS
ncbi:unnamed protein product, partial [Tuber aestivum]